MSDQEMTQDAAQLSIQTVAEMLDKQSSMLSEMMDSMKGAYATTVRGTHVKEDVGSDELISHHVAELAGLSQFWANQIMFQTTIANAETLRAMSNNNLITNQANWNGTSSRSA